MNRSVSLMSLIFLLVLGVPASGGESREALMERLAGAKEPRILFIGNSYSFKVPKVLRARLEARGLAVKISQVTKGGWTLKRHAGSKETLEAIRKERWDVVVLQEQSQLPSLGKAVRGESMLPHAKILTAEIRKAGAVPVFFLTWGRRDGDTRNAATFPDDTFARMQKRLDTGYAEAAAACGQALVVPVGTAWAKEVAAGTGGTLFAKDGSHPSARGVELSAKVFAEFLFGSQDR